MGHSRTGFGLRDDGQAAKDSDSGTESVRSFKGAGG